MEQTKPMILCFGDSLTFGTPGVTYLRFMKNIKHYINKSVGGDTLVNMKRRLQPCLDDPNACRFIVEIGTYDLLLPHMETRSEA